MIEFACQSCGKPLVAPDGSHGRKGRCRHCGQVVVIGNPAGASLEVEIEGLGDEAAEEAIGQPAPKLPPFDFGSLLAVMVGVPILAGVGLVADPTGWLREEFLKYAEWSERHGVGYWIIGMGFVALAVRMIYGLWAWALDTGEPKRDVFAIERAAGEWLVESAHHTRKAAKERARNRAARRERERARADQAARHARELEAAMMTEERQAEVAKAEAARAEASNPLTSCRDCGASISKRAAACPHCGAPMMAQTARSAQPVHSQHARQGQVFVRQQVVVAPRRGGDALGCGCCFVLLGLLLCCLFWPLGLLLMVFGFVLVLVSLFL